MPAIFPAATNGGGMCQAFPDVCKVPAPPAPPIPSPFPNMGPLNQATGTCKKVMILGKEAVTTKSKIPKSMGDEPGTLGGMVSGQNMGPITFKKGSSKVKGCGTPLVYHTATTAHNGNNANAPAGVQVAPSQQKVILAP